MTTERSDHAELLNHLADMQASPQYAVRRQVLQQAAHLILEQERRIYYLETTLAQIKGLAGATV